MNTTKKLLTTLLLALMLPVIAIAEVVYDFKVDGIYYKIAENQVTVTYKTHSYSSHTHYYESDYTGDVTIPATVTYNGITYPVTKIGNHAFYNCGSVTSITIPSSITAIELDAFSGCTGLTHVNITDIAAWCNMTCGSGDNPLRYAQHLYLNDVEVTHLVIPESVTYIRNEAFSQCIGLTSVTIGNSVTTIGNNAFEDCTGLTSVSVGNSVTEIGSVAFEGCTSLTSVNLGRSVTTIGGSAFAGCTALTGIRIPNTVTNIDGGAFSGCTSLAIANIGKSVTSIGIAAFKNCESLTSIDIPNSVSSIGDLAFSGCTNLTSVEIGKSVTTIGKDAFQNAPSIDIVICKATTPPLWNDMSMFTTNVYNHSPLHVPTDSERAYKTDLYWGQFLTIIADVGEQGIGDNVVIDGLCYILNEENRTATVTNYSNAPVSTEVVEYSGDIVIPEIITTQSGKSYIVTAIDYKAFYRCNTITSMSIPPSIKTIGYYAFVGCNSLERVYIQDIAAWCNIVFENINANPLFSNYYNVSLYVNGSRLTQLDIPKGVTSIGNYAFYDASLSKVSFPNTLVSIGNYAFHNNSMTEVILPESLESLGIGAFAGCASLEKVHLNDGLEVIPIEAFAGCSQLSEVSLPLTIKKIEDIAFLGCQKLSTMPMTDSLQVIGDDAFHDSGIEQLKTGKSLTSIGFAAFGECQNLTSVEINDPVTTLGKSTFVCSHVRKAVIGNGVHKIPEWLFGGCGDLNSVALGNAVDTLEEYCFGSCSKIDTIVCMAAVPPVVIGNEVFSPVIFQNATLYVPFGSVEAYKTANVWKNFQKIVAVNDENDDDYEYVPFVREGVKWVYSIVNYRYNYVDQNPEFLCEKIYRTLELKGDTIINGKTYKAMHKYSGNSINWENDTVPIYLREENKLVYGIIPDQSYYNDCPIYSYLCYFDMYNGEEFLLYDFQDPENYWNDYFDAYPISNPYQHLYTDTISIGNHKAKRYVNQLFEVRDWYMVEGIGIDDIYSYTLGFFFPVITGVGGLDFGLSHVIENGRIIYKGIHYIPGDVNGDGEVTIADANSVIDVVIMGGNAGHTRAPAADMDGNGEVNVTDLNIVIDLIIKGN